MRNGYIGKYPADTKARTVVRYLASEPDRATRMAVTRQLVKQYEFRLSRNKYESDKGVVNLVKNTMEKAVVNYGVGKTKEVRNNTLRKGSTGLLCQRAGKQLEQQRSVLGYRNGYNNGYICKYPSDTLHGYIGKYPADTNVWAVVRYLENEPDCAKRLAVTRQLRTRYLAVVKLGLPRKRYGKQ